MSIQLHDRVKFAKPYPGEEVLRFRVIELNGDRCFVEAICDLPIPPQSVQMVADLVKAED